jgi:hypothetical protein
MTNWVLFVNLREELIWLFVNAVICEKGLIGYLFNRLIGRRDYLVNLVIWGIRENQFNSLKG